MKEQIILREYLKTDQKALEDVVRSTWNYDRFCSPKTAAKMAKAFLYSCLNDQTFTQVAVLNGEPVGIIMGKNTEALHCPLSLRIKWIASIISLCISKEGRKMLKMFSGIDGIDQELLSQCKEKYKGEVEFFAISETCRGKGIGKKLFLSVVQYMKSQNINQFYLFTDTTCNYPFYEHMGLKRQGEKKHAIDVKGQKEDTTFFIYDYQIKEDQI